MRPDALVAVTIIVFGTKLPHLQTHIRPQRTHREPKPRGETARNIRHQYPDSRHTLVLGRHIDNLTCTEIHTLIMILRFRAGLTLESRKQSPSYNLPSESIAVELPMLSAESPPRGRCSAQYRAGARARAVAVRSSRSGTLRQARGDGSE